MYSPITIIRFHKKIQKYFVKYLRINILKISFSSLFKSNLNQLIKCYSAGMAELGGPFTI